MGYSHEDEEYMVVCFDENLRERTDTNNVASAFVHSEHVLAGQFVLAKFRRPRADGADGAEDDVGAGSGSAQLMPLRLPKAEIVDIAIWRRHLCSRRVHGERIGHSTRMHRENMRRAERQELLQGMRFENVYV